MIWHLFDLMEYSCKSALLLYLCRDYIAVKEKYRSFGKILFFLQSVLVSYYLSNSAWVQKALYGEGAKVVQNSSRSIVKLLLVMCCSYLFMEVLYQGGRLAKFYIILLFYTVQEMARFALHGIWSLGNMAYINYLNDLIMKEEADLEAFQRMFHRWEYLNYFFFAAGYLSAMFLTLYFYKKNCTDTVEEINRQGLCFLILTPSIGLVFGMALRVIFYTQSGTDIELLYEKHGSMYAVIPVTAMLCLVLVVYSRRIYSQLIQAQEEQNKLLIFKQQFSDMTEHIKELEQLYDGIRGMRHDVNNYVADMEQLLQVSTEQGKIQRQEEEEARKYLQGVEQAVSGLAGRFSTGNPVTDVILNRKWQICEKEEISFEEEFLFPAGMGIEAFDIGILLNNALDNAIEACRKADGPKRYIRLESYKKGRMFLLTVENAFEGELKKTGDGILETTKPDAQMHGLGMSNMQSCVDKYFGTLAYQAGEGRFRLTIMLQGSL